MLIAKPFSTHPRRTIMFSEMARVMNAGSHSESFQQVMSENVTSKKTKSNILQTNKELIALYSFDIEYSPFKVLNYFWNTIGEDKKALVAFLFAYGRDYLLFESSDVILHANIGDEVKSIMFEENIEKYHPNHYSVKTRQSISRNLRSSWNQGGYLSGKTTQIRKFVFPDYNIVAFSLALAFIDGLRGDFLFTSKWVKVLDITESQVRELALEAARRDLLQYNYAGGVTTISFNNLLNKLNINVIDSR